MEIGQERTVDEYVENLVRVFRETRRVLRDDGTLWIVIGDTYTKDGGRRRPDRIGASSDGQVRRGEQMLERQPPQKLGQKQRLLVPWRLALALQADGWRVRQDIVWAAPNKMPECLDPGTQVFIREGAWVSRVTLGDLEKRGRLVEVLGPEGWVQARRIWKTRKPAMYVEAGKVEKVVCSPDHRFPVSSDRRRERVRLEECKDIRHEGYADYLLYCPVGQYLKPTLTSWAGVALDAALGYLLGVYVAEGGPVGGASRKSGAGLKFTIGAHETEFAENIRGVFRQLALEHRERVERNAREFYVTDLWFTRIAEAFVSGNVRTKALNVDLILNCPEEFRKAVLGGYVEGDGSDGAGGGWTATSASARLRDDIATLASSVGVITSKGQTAQKDARTGKVYRAYQVRTPYTTRRKTKAGRAGMFQVPPRSRKLLAEDREMIDLEVDGGVFLIGNGLVTHNSVKDRFTQSHEYVLMLSKREHYVFDLQAVKEPCTSGKADRRKMVEARDRISAKHLGEVEGVEGALNAASEKSNIGRKRAVGGAGGLRNPRSVWTIPTTPFRGRHFAVFPIALASKAILAGSMPHVCAGCGAPYRRVLGEKRAAEGRGSGNQERKFREEHGGMAEPGSAHLGVGVPWIPVVQETVGFVPTCGCGVPAAPATVLDMFAGAMTTAIACERLGRNCVAVELNEEYARLGLERVEAERAKFAKTKGKR